MLRTALQTKPPATERTAPLAEDQINTGRPDLVKAKRIAAMATLVIKGQITKAFTLSSRSVTRLTSLPEAASQREALHRKRSNDCRVPSRLGKTTSNKSRKPRQTLAPIKTPAKVSRAQAERRYCRLWLPSQFRMDESARFNRDSV